MLADGRFLFSGGEYNNNQFDLTSLGAIYNPFKNTWTKLGHPSGWKWIGDSPSTMLPNNKFLIGDKLHTWDATYDPTTGAWAHVGDAGKADFNAEEGWTLLAGWHRLDRRRQERSGLRKFTPPPPAHGRPRATLL